MMAQRGFYTLCLLIMGIGWGATIPLTKVAVSEGYQEFGLIFWQQIICAFVLGIVLCIRRQGVGLGRPQIVAYVIIAVFGTVLPNTASYEAAVHLPGGVLAILISTVPMFAFPIALLLGIERFSWRRTAGLCLGLFSVMLMVAPETSLPEQIAVVFIPIALIAPIFYAFEGNYVAKWGIGGLDPVQALFGASLVGSVISLILALGSGQFIDPRGPWGMPDYAFVTSSLMHAVIYTAYIWLVGRAGPVFAAQVAYLVTLFGIFWSVWLLDEAYSKYVWLALSCMLLGIFLVLPRYRKNTRALAEPSDIGT